MEIPSIDIAEVPQRSERIEEWGKKARLRVRVM